MTRSALHHLNTRSDRKDAGSAAQRQLPPDEMSSTAESGEEILRSFLSGDGRNHNAQALMPLGLSFLYGTPPKGLCDAEAGSQSKVPAFRVC